MKYTINLSAWASTAVDFETEETDPAGILEAFWDSGPDMPTLCHQRSGGHRYSQNRELADDWEVDVFDGKPSINPAIE